jgi:hypothetical protein
VCVVLPCVAYGTTLVTYAELDEENELMRIQHEHVQNMPEFIGFNEEFEEEEARIRQEYGTPASLTGACDRPNN